MKAATKLTFLSFVMAIFGGTYLIASGSAVGQEEASARAPFEQPSQTMMATMKRDTHLGEFPFLDPNII